MKLMGLCEECKGGLNRAWGSRNGCDKLELCNFKIPKLYYITHYDKIFNKQNPIIQLLFFTTVHWYRSTLLPLK